MRISHRNAKVVYPFTGETLVLDKPIVPLLKMIWGAGIETTNSCIKHRIFKKPCTHRTWIAFRRTDDAEQFVSMITSRLETGDEMLARIYGDTCVDYGIEGGVYCKGIHWIYDVDHTGIYHDVKDPIRFSISIWFPLADYERVCELFQKAVAESED